MRIRSAACRAPISAALPGLDSASTFSASESRIAASAWGPAKKDVRVASDAGSVVGSSARIRTPRSPDARISWQRQAIGKEWRSPARRRRASIPWSGSARARLAIERRRGWISGQRRSERAARLDAPRTLPPAGLLHRTRLPSRDQIQAGTGERSNTPTSGAAPNARAVSCQGIIKRPSPPNRRLVNESLWQSWGDRQPSGGSLHTYSPTLVNSGVSGRRQMVRCKIMLHCTISGPIWGSSSSDANGDAYGNHRDQGSRRKSGRHRSRRRLLPHNPRRRISRFRVFVSEFRSSRRCFAR